jgi:L-malate glycosyltransferase
MENKKKSILIMSSVYPTNSNDDFGPTKVVHYFAKEWVKIGYEVNVINNINKYPIFYYLIPSFIRNILSSKLGFMAPKLIERKENNFIIDNVNVFTLPIVKKIPFGKYSKIEIAKQINKINILLEYFDIKPDIITGHWENPQILLIPEVNKNFKAKTAIILHGLSYIKKYKIFRHYIQFFDKIGFRNKVIENRFNKFLPNIQGFICHSGIPNTYFSKKPDVIIDNKFKGDFFKCVYAGHFLKRKNINTIIKALTSNNFLFKYSLNIIGSGPEKNNLIKFTKKIDKNKVISFTGPLKRDKVIDIFQSCDYFIMISKNEVFGLVYLEAMSQGMIVIASNNEGMSGIINDGINGFLCNAGDEADLIKTIKRIELLSIDEKKLISINAINTAKQFTDQKVAQDYLSNINL